MTTASGLEFALNHMVAPGLPVADFFALSARLGLTKAEIRNDLAGTAILDGTSPEAIRQAAARHGQTLLTINALQRFNEWTADRAAEADDLAGWCAATGAAALILVPKNDGTGCGPDDRRENLAEALAALAPILARHGVLGFVEPLGFEICSLRLKSEAAAGIRALAERDPATAGRFRITHDTFHHHLAGEAAIFPDLTGLIHLSGVDDPSVPTAEMRDTHRVLVGPLDRVGNIAQVAQLFAAGAAVPCSFEPFSDQVHRSADLAAELKTSMHHIRSGLAAA